MIRFAVPTLTLCIGIYFASVPAFAQSQKTNYDETKIPKYELPSLMKMNDGSAVKNQQDWEKRRAEVLELFKQHVFGTMPTPPASGVRVVREIVRESKVKIRVKPRDTSDLSTVDARLKEVKLFLGPNKTGPVINLLLALPAEDDKTAYPAFLAYNFKGNHTLLDSQKITKNKTWNRERKLVDPPEESRGERAGRWPLGMILDRGYAVVTMYYGDVDPDFDDGFKNGVHPLFPKLQNRPDNWSSIGAWSWGLHRVMDYLENESAINSSQVALMGHSRLGKTALWAGATDQRFKVVISNNSGCGGAALARRRIGETVGRINTVFPHWFCQRHKTYNNNEDKLPVDQHMLIAMMAPRAVYVASAKGDRWADPKGEFLATFHAQPAWKLLGEKKLIEKEALPELGKSVGHVVGYHIRKGKHDVKLEDWNQYLIFARRHFQR